MPYLYRALEENGRCELICLQHICRKEKLLSVFSQMIMLRVEKDEFYPYCEEKWMAEIDWEMNVPMKNSFSFIWRRKTNYEWGWGTSFQGTFLWNLKDLNGFQFALFQDNNTLTTKSRPDVHFRRVDLLFLFSNALKLLLLKPGVIPRESSNLMP